MEIRIDDLRGPEVQAMLEEHLRGVSSATPPESVHALGLEDLRKPEVTFWTVWHESQLMGCGAIKQLNLRQGEIKSMRTATAHLRKGVASRLMQHMIDEAQRRRYQQLYLETGSGESFLAARKLYEAFGFKECGPFADYVLDPYSVFMVREM